MHMALDAFNTIFYTVGFVVPGFILRSTLAALVPEREIRKDLAFLRFLTLSSINYAICSWLIYLIFRLPFFTTHPIRTAIAWAVIIFISPVFLGVLLARLKDKDIIRRALQRIGFNPIHGIPTAWDYKFNKTAKPVWVVITFKNGDQVGGLFGTKSFASSDPQERDLYIEQVYKITTEGPWQHKPRTDGMLISKDEVRWIEYWQLEKENPNVRTETSPTS
jgi:hypothetical protein